MRILQLLNAPLNYDRLSLLWGTIYLGNLIEFFGHIWQFCWGAGGYPINILTSPGYPRLAVVPMTEQVQSSYRSVVASLVVTALVFFLLSEVVSSGFHDFLARRLNVERFPQFKNHKNFLQGDRRGSEMFTMFP